MPRKAICVGYGHSTLRLGVKPAGAAQNLCLGDALDMRHLIRLTAPKEVTPLRAVRNSYICRSINKVHSDCVGDNFSSWRPVVASVPHVTHVCANVVFQVRATSAAAQKSELNNGACLRFYSSIGSPGCAWMTFILGYCTRICSSNQARAAVLP